jgi:tetraacyldisaccharide 4'-kinase
MSWGNPQSLAEHICIKLQMPFTAIYAGVSSALQTAYKKQSLASRKLSKPVISIGNLTVGGTGKTPITIDLASTLISHNIKVGILSRGYKRKKSESITVVSDGQGNISSLEEAGDEPLMMAQALPQAVVIVGQNRYLSGQKAIDEFHSQVLLLDDGFQHWRLERNYDIVLLDYNDEPWNDNLLPAGRLRESLSALQRANHVIITKIPINYDLGKIERFEKLISKYNQHCGVSLCRFMPSSIRQLIGDQWQDFSIDKLKGLPVIVFCGLAKPESFCDSLEELSANIVKTISYPDHHIYSDKDIDYLEQARIKSGAEFFVTTRKDLIKLQGSTIKSKILAINLSTEWITNELNIISLVKSPTLLNKTT